MPNKCKKCGRLHTGLCGIPPGVTMGYGARVGGVSVKKERAANSAKPSTNTLKGLIEWAESEREKVLNILRVVPTDEAKFNSRLVEYDQLQEKLEKLESVIDQVRKQLADRGE